MAIKLAASSALITCEHTMFTSFPGVAQLGSASALGAEGRRFKSCHPDESTGIKLFCTYL